MVCSLDGTDAEQAPDAVENADDHAGRLRGVRRELVSLDIRGLDHGHPPLDLGHRRTALGDHADFAPVVLWKAALMMWGPLP